MKDLALFGNSWMIHLDVVEIATLVLVVEFVRFRWAFDWLRWTFRFVQIVFTYALVWNALLALEHYYYTRTAGVETWLRGDSIGVLEGDFIRPFQPYECAKYLLKDLVWFVFYIALATLFRYRLSRREHSMSDNVDIETIFGNSCRDGM